MTVRGDDLERLRAVLSDALLLALETNVAAVAGLAKQLRDTNRELESLPVESNAEVTKLEQLRAKRAASGRVSDTAVAGPTGRRSQPRRSNGSHRAS